MGACAGYRFAIMKAEVLPNTRSTVVAFLTAPQNLETELRFTKFVNCQAYSDIVNLLS
jgi:hypothetical protein